MPNASPDRDALMKIACLARDLLQVTWSTEPHDQADALEEALADFGIWQNPNLPPFGASPKAGPSSSPAHGIAVHPSHLPTVVDLLEDDVERLKSALGEIAALGERCEECEPTEAPFATHVAVDPLTGIPGFYCDSCAENERAARRKAESKGCGKQPPVEEHEQDTAVTLALAALFTRPDSKGGT